MEESDILRERVGELERECARLNHMVNSAPAFFWSNDSDSEPFASAAAKLLSGYDPEEFRGQPTLWLDLVHADDKDLVTETLKQARRDEVPTPIQFRITHKDKSIRWLDATFIPTLENDSNTIGVYGFAVDATRFRETESDLKAKTEQQSKILEALPVVAYSCRSDGDFGATFVSNNARRLTGFSPNDFTSSSSFWASRIHPDDESRVLEYLSQIFDTDTITLEYRWQAKDGSYMTFCDHIRTVRRDDGTVSHFVGSWQDITELKRAERELLIRNHVLASTRDGLLITDPRQPDNPIIYCNPAFQQMTGYTEQEILGRNCRFLQNEDRNQPALDGIRAAIREERDCRVTLRNYRKNGEMFWNELTLCPVLDEEKRLTHFIGVQNDITERKQAERSLEQHAQQQASIAQLGQAAVVGNDLDALMDEVAHAIADVLAMEYCKVLEILPGEGKMLLRAGVGWKEGLVGNATIGTNRQSQAGYALVCGEPVIAEDLRTESRFSGPPLLHDHGVVSGISAIIRGTDGPFGVLGAHTAKPRTYSQDDVSFLQVCANLLADAIQRKHADEGLRESEQRYRNLLDNHVDAMGMTVDGKIVYANQQMAQLTGYAAGEIIGRSPVAFFIPKDRERAGKRIAELAAGAVATPAEYQLIHKDGHSLDVEVLSDLIRHDGNPALLTVMRDITKRKRTKMALEAIVAGTASITGTNFFPTLARELAYVLEVTHILVSEYVNEPPTRARVLGSAGTGDTGAIEEYVMADTPCSEVVNGNVVLYHRDVQQSFPLDKLLQEWNIESYLGVALRSNSGKPIGHLVIMDDKPMDANFCEQPPLKVFAARAAAELDRLHAERALTDSESRFRTLVEHAPEAIVVLDVESNRLVDVNQNTLDLFKMDRESLLKIDPAELHTATQSNGQPSSELAGDLIERTLAGATPVIEWTFVDAEGNEIPTEVRLVRLPSANHKLVRGSITDISERKQLEVTRRQLEVEKVQAKAEMSLLQSQRLASIGTLAAGIAHEINNPVGATLLAAETALSCKDDKDKSSVVEQALNDICKNSRRCGRIVKSVLKFARHETLIKTPMTVNSCIHSSIKWTQVYSMASGVNIDFIPAEVVPDIYADDTEMIQALSNLFRNAVDSRIDSGQKLTVTVGTELAIDALRIVVQDNGRGISEEDQRHVFDPFYTTRRTHGGTGLGLSLTHTIVTEHGGTIEIDSKLGKGTRITLSFPLETAGPEGLHDESHGRR